MTSSARLLTVMWERIVQPSDALVVPEQRRLARLLSILLLAMMAATVLANVSIFMSDPTYLTTTFPTTGPGLLAIAVSYALSRTRHYRLAALIVLAALSAASLAGAVINPAYRIIGPLTMTQGLLLAAFFFSARETSFIALANWIALMLVLFALPGSRAAADSVATAFLVTLESATILVWLRYRDQAERERQADLLESAERFQHMADSVPILIWMSGIDMLCTYFNHPWLEFTGRPLEMELGNGWSEGVHPDDLARCLNAYVSAFKDRKPFSMEYRLRRADGEYRWVRDDGAARIASNGVFLGYIGGCVDITDRKLAEEALREREELYRTLFEKSPVGFGLADMDGNLLAFNDAILRPGGYIRDDMVRIGNVGALYHNLAERDRLLDLARRQGFLDQAPVQFKRKDGSPYDALLSLRSVRHNGQPCWQAMVEDITDRKQAEEALRQSEARFHAVYDQAPLGIALVDSKSGQFLDINPKYCEILDRDRSKMLKLDIQTVTYPDDLQSNLDHLKQLVTGEISHFRMEKRYIRPNGSIVWVNLSVVRLQVDGGKVFHHLAMVEDITDRKQAEEALKESEAKYRHLVDHSLQGMIIFQESRFVFANAAMSAITGYSVDEMLAMPPEQVVSLIHPDDRAWVAAKIRRRLAGLDAKPHDEHRLVRADGQIRTLELLVSTITYQGKPALLANYIDLTERKLAEQELERYREHLEELVNQRTAELEAANEQLVRLGNAKDEFVSNVSHELRAPLTNMKLRQWLVRSHPEELEQHLSVMERETERLRRIIEDLLQLSRLDQNPTELDLSTINLNELISRYVADRSLISNSKELRVVFSGKARQPLVQADESLLEEVLGVLITNATNYTPSGGSINIFTARLKKQGRRWVGFSITDTGPGIHPDDRPYLFERFFRGESARRSGAAGTGLGLALAKQIVERHGGLIEAVNSDLPAKGARFDVWLPESLA